MGGGISIFFEEDLLVTGLIDKEEPVLNGNGLTVTLETELLSLVFPALSLILTDLLFWKPRCR